MLLLSIVHLRMLTFISHLVSTKTIFTGYNYYLIMVWWIVCVWLSVSIMSCNGVPARHKAVHPPSVSNPMTHCHAAYYPIISDLSDTWIPIPCEVLQNTTLLEHMKLINTTLSNVTLPEHEKQLASHSFLVVCLMLLTVGFVVDGLLCYAKLIQRSLQRL